MAANPSITMADVKALVAKREALEKEIEELSSWLTSPGRPGIRGGLIDKDGFPLGDVQLVISTREARSKLAALQNDHKALMKTIEDSLQQLHAQARIAKENAPKPQSSQQQQAPPPLKPFARINSVAEGSPAHKAGLLKDDLIVKMGSIILTTTPQDALKAIPSVVKEGEALKIIIQRAEQTGAQSQMNLIPHHWAGPGLLGCHLLPYTQ